MFKRVKANDSSDEPVRQYKLAARSPAPIRGAKDL
jgi:hypothetical protein